MHSCHVGLQACDDGGEPLDRWPQTIQGLSAVFVLLRRISKQEGLNCPYEMHVQDVLLADPSKNKNGAKPLNRSVVYIIANNPKKSNGLGQWMLRLFAATARGTVFCLYSVSKNVGCWLPPIASPLVDF